VIWLTDPIELKFGRDLILTSAIIHSWLISLQLVFDNILEVRIFFAPFGSYITEAAGILSDYTFTNLP
jgi:hypothetical protein